MMLHGRPTTGLADSLATLEELEAFIVALLPEAMQPAYSGEIAGTLARALVRDGWVAERPPTPPASAAPRVELSEEAIDGLDAALTRIADEQTGEAEEAAWLIVRRALARGLRAELEENLEDLRRKLAGEDEPE